MKKQYILLLLISLFSFTLGACDLSNTTTTTSSIKTTLSSDTTISISNSTTSVPETSTSTTTTTTYNQTTTTTTTVVNDASPFTPSGYSLLQNELDSVGIPATGDVKILVFAVDFSDYPSSTSDVSINDIEIAFNGDSSQLNYESLKSYYQISSYGRLSITADIYGFYRASNSASYYEDEYEKLWAVDPVTGDWVYDEVTYPNSDLIYELLDYYDDSIDYSLYDGNKDGYIDGIYIIYTHPVSYSSGSEIWWAYQDYYSYEGSTFDGVDPYYYVWSGTEFFTEGDDNINSRTIIHETGHMLGLDDYYDYDDSDEYNSGGLGGADMMDSTIGDQNPFSKLMLGWITPLVVTESMDVDITPFLEDGQVILLIDEWSDTLFDEYLLISYFTPNGLNQDDTDILFDQSGIIIYHVSAKIGSGYDSGSAYYTIFNYNNTDTLHKLIKIIEADMNGDIDNYSLAENSDLFEVGDILGLNIYADYSWLDNTSLGITIEIVSITNDFASLKIVFK
ncbi:MAG: M6 family metalloprotease domain-containing protein [Bacilli bacterium]|nr:M6 family metalloprotease domain-containing protein [Bacilli bacterium]